IHNALLIFLLLAPALFQRTCKPVGTNASLIESACHNANVPATCLQCLKSDQRAQKADEVGVAIIVVSCLSNHTKNLVSNMTQLASGAQDKNLKTICEACGKGYSTALTDLSAATLKITNGEYDEANLSVRNALESEVECQRSIGGNQQKIKPSFPVDVLYEMKVYEQLSDAALRIIDRL
ncbi:PMEI domain-containing protein, partial [Cephalotus follicularis]